jgi:hypothetical protein
MPETEDTANEIKKLRLSVQNVESSLEMMLRHSAADFRKAKLALFSGDEELKAVYLAIDGRRTQAEIVELLLGTPTKPSQPTVSRRMNKLEDEGLISKVSASKSGIVYQKNELLEKVLRLSRHLQNA